MFVRRECSGGCGVFIKADPRIRFCTECRKRLTKQDFQEEEFFSRVSLHMSGDINIVRQLEEILEPGCVEDLSHLCPSLSVVA